MNVNPSLYSGLLNSAKISFTPVEQVTQIDPASDSNKTLNNQNNFMLLYLSMLKEKNNNLMFDLPSTSTSNSSNNTFLDLILSEQFKSIVSDTRGMVRKTII